MVRVFVPARDLDAYRIAMRGSPWSAPYDTCLVRGTAGFRSREVSFAPLRAIPTCFSVCVQESAKGYPCGVDCAIVAALYMRIMRTCACTGCVAGAVVGAGARAGAVVGPRAFAVAVAGLRARVRLLVPARLRLRLGVRAGAVVGARAVAVAVAGLRARARLLVPVRLRLRWRLLLRLRARVRWLVPARLRCARTRCHCPGIAVAPWNLYYCVACSLRLQ